MIDRGSSRPIDILLVEDSPGDVELTRIAFREAEIANNLHVVKDGVEALAFLRRQAPFADAPRPDLVLLDLNLPRKNGKEVLEEAKSDPDLRRIPVIILTTSREDADILASYGMHANSYIAKPLALEDFIEVLRRFDQYWMGAVQLPPA